MNRDSFTKEHSLILKGFMVMLLLFHHVFYGDAVAEQGIILSAGREDIFGNLVSYARLCISGFAFVSAYGVTRQFMASSGRLREYLEICVSRLVKISVSCLFVYVAAVIYKRFVVVQSIKEIYRDASGVFHPLYMVFDALGFANLLGTPLLNATWWYFSYVIMMICALPAIFILCRKIRVFALPLAMFLFDSMTGIAVLGVLFAYEDIFGKLQETVQGGGKNRQIFRGGGILFLCLAAVGCSYSIVASERNSAWPMYWAGAVYAVIVMLYVSKIPVLSDIMKWIGKYSATMFMTHTFIYMYFYEEFIYSFQRDYMIYGVLFGCSLVTAIVIDTLRWLLRYDKLIACINDKIKMFLRRNLYDKF